MSLVNEEHNVCSQSVPVVPENESESFMFDGEMQRCTFGSHSERRRLALSTYGDTVISLLSSGFCL